jgi:hypothetical protein
MSTGTVTAVTAATRLPICEPWLLSALYAPYALYALYAKKWSGGWEEPTWVMEPLIRCAARSLSFS